MLKSVMAGASFAVLLGGCSAANATDLDAGNDVHCFALATAFTGYAQSVSAPADQQRAIAAIEKWYGVKFDAAVAARGKENLLAEGEALARVVDEDLEATKAALMACMERAVADPAFEAFAARL